MAGIASSLPKLDKMRRRWVRVKLQHIVNNVQDEVVSNLPFRLYDVKLEDSTVKRRTLRRVWFSTEPPVVFRYDDVSDRFVEVLIALSTGQQTAALSLGPYGIIKTTARPRLRTNRPVSVSARSAVTRYQIRMGGHKTSTIQRLIRSRTNWRLVSN